MHACVNTCLLPFHATAVSRVRVCGVQTSARCWRKRSWCSFAWTTVCFRWAGFMCVTTSTRTRSSSHFSQNQEHCAHARNRAHFRAAAVHCPCRRTPPSPASCRPWTNTRMAATRRCWRRLWQLSWLHVMQTSRPLCSDSQMRRTAVPGCSSSLIARYVPCVCHFVCVCVQRCSRSQVTPPAAYHPQSMQLTGFHPHTSETPIYGNASHAALDELPLIVADLRAAR